MPFFVCVCISRHVRPPSWPRVFPEFWQCPLLVAVGIVKTMRCLPSRFWAQQCACPPGPAHPLCILNPDWLWVFRKRTKVLCLCLCACVCVRVWVCMSVFKTFFFLSFLFLLFFFKKKKWQFVHKYRVQPSCSHYKTDSMFSHHSWSSRL